MLNSFNEVDMKDSIDLRVNYKDKFKETQRPANGGALCFIVKIALLY